MIVIIRMVVIIVIVVIVRIVMGIKTHSKNSSIGRYSYTSTSISWATSLRVQFERRLVDLTFARKVSVSTTPRLRLVAVNN